MKATNKSADVEMSYFRLSLLSYLRESHPEKATDKQFIASRGDTAAEAYSSIIKSGGSHDEAEEAASQILYAGLHFSPYRTIVNILWDEFTDETDPALAEGLAIELLPRLSAVIKKYSESREINQARLSLSEAHPVLCKYTLSDDFADSAEYRLLYTELTGAIQILLEDGVQ
ncbi:hypothetical protein FACS1894182_15320 [Bacteroidia bacterium]|nr:hypothetical protein FACS1894182_15320 [Bacteroidia bacterium]